MHMDTQAPNTPSIHNPTGGNKTNAAFSLTLNSGDNASGVSYYQYSYDQVNWNTYANSASNSFVTTPFSVERNQLVYIRCVDHAGNVSGVNSTRIWIEYAQLGTSAITTSTYGGTTNYSANGVTSWEIFYNDGTYIYLISTDIVPSSGLNRASNISTSGDYVRARDGCSSTLVEWMANTSYWTAYASGFSGAVAYGGPAQDMLYGSYNAKNGTSLIPNSPATLSGHPWVSSEGYWLASVVHDYFMWGVDSVGDVQGGDVAGRSGIRPLVRLPAGVRATQGSDGKWNFSM